MRLATKSTAVLSALFLVGLGLAAIWIERDFRDTSREVMAETADLIARQITATLYEPILDRVMNRDADAYADLRQTVESAIDRSDTIIGLAIVGADGTLLAGGNENDHYPDAKALFGSRPVVQVASRYESRFTIGNHIALVPITRRGALKAYARIELSNRQIGNIYDRLVSRFANFGLIGISTILFLGGLLHVELSRIGRQIVSLMSPGKDGSLKPATFANDEFTPVRDRALEFRKNNQQRKTALDALTDALEIGLVFFQSPEKANFASNSARELLGCNEESDGIVDGVDEAGWTQVSEAVQELVDSNETSAVYRTGFLCGDEVRKLEFELFQISDSEPAVIAVIRNQEQVSALESSLRAATRMHTLSSIYMGAAHDLRGPIGAMIINLELLEESIQNNSGQLSDEQSQNQKRYLDVLRDELIRLQRFLTGFLENATTSDDAHWKEIELTTVIEELLSLFRIKASLSRVMLETQFPDSPVRIHGSDEQIRQLFMNVIVNALESMPEGGQLTAIVEQEVTDTRIRFLDTGPGLPKSLADQVFDLHFTTKDTGTGIGLHVAKTIVKQHGGEIRFKSELGNGSCVEILLPTPIQDAT